MNDNLTDHFILDAIRPVLLKAFAKHGARDFSDEQWRRLIHEEKQQDQIRVLRGFQKFLGWLSSNSRTPGGIPFDPELMEYTRILYNWKEYIFHRGCSFSIIHSILENGLVPGGKERHKGRQTVFLSPLNPFGGDSDCEEPSDVCAVPQKVHCHSHCKHNQDGVHWVTWSRAQDQGLQFVQPKSHAIIVHNLVPAECIYKVISQIRGRPLFERLSTPRPVPQVTLKSHWQSQQQQQQSICDDVSTSTRKLVTDQTGIQWCQRLHNGWSD